MHIELNELPGQLVPCLQSSIANKNHTLVDDEIALLIEEKIIVPSSYEPGEFVSPIVLRSKKTVLSAW